MFRIEWSTTSGAVEAIELDAEVRSTWEGTAEIAEHAVEQGSHIADHVRPNNATITVEGMITNTPIVLPGTQMMGVSGAVSSTEVEIGGRRIALNVLQFDATVDRIRLCDQVLDELRTSAQLLHVTNGIRELENVVLTRYTLNWSAEVGEALDFTLELKRMRLVSTSRVTAPRPLQRRAQPTVDRGQQPPQSLLNRGFNALEQFSRGRGAT